MSKNDPARNKPATQRRPDEIDPDSSRAADPAVEESPASDEEVLTESQESAVAEEPAHEEIERLHAELDEAKDRALRTQAELENYRKRVAREMQEERRYANLPLIRDLLPVWDNMGRAIEAAEKTHETASLLEGFKMVAGELESVLQRHHCFKIDAMGQPFDPNLQEAISQQPSHAHSPNTVLVVAQTGFRLHDRVVRPSQVIVSTAAPGEKETPEAETKNEPNEPAASEGTDNDAHL